MQRALRKVQGENPDVKPVSISSSDSSLMNRLFAPKGAMATTNPFTGNIHYNPKQLQGIGQDELENTVAHELTHSRQAQNTPWYKTVAGLFSPDETVPQGAPSSMDTPYHWRPQELEAFDAERARTLSHHLPWMRDPVTGMGDIQLMKQKVKVGPTSGKLQQLVTGVK
jgi:hypothetical protein